MKHFRRSLLWPITILLSVGAVSFVTFVNVGNPIQGIAVLWFVTLCPGMSLVPLLKLRQLVIELTLAVALSLSIDAIVVGIFLYTGRWSTPDMLWVLVAVCLIGSMLQVLPLGNSSTDGRKEGTDSQDEIEGQQQ